MWQRLVLEVFHGWARRHGPESRSRRPGWSAKPGLSALPERDGPSALSDVGTSLLLAPHFSAAVDLRITNEPGGSEDARQTGTAWFSSAGEAASGSSRSGPHLFAAEASTDNPVDGRVIALGNDPEFARATESLPDHADSPRPAPPADQPHSGGPAANSATGSPTAQPAVHPDAGTLSARLPFSPTAAPVAPGGIPAQAEQTKSPTGSPPPKRIDLAPPKDQPKLAPSELPAVEPGVPAPAFVAVATEATGAEAEVPKVPDDGTETTARADGDAPILTEMGPATHVAVFGGISSVDVTVQRVAASVDAVPTVSSHAVEGNSEVPDAGTELFRISRPTPAANEVEVGYALKEYSPNGETVHEGVAVIPAGETQVSVRAGVALAGRPLPVLTLALREQPEYAVGNRTVTRITTAPNGRVDDVSLLAAFRGGSQEAFQAIVQQHKPGVVSACQRIVKNWADAEDVSQFVFLALARLKVPPTTSLGGWLQKVSRNAAISLLRARGRRDRHEFEAARPTAAADDESNRLLGEVLQNAMEKLPAPLQDAVRLRYIEGWSQQEAAHIVGCPRGTLSQRTSLGINLLRNILTDSKELVC